MSSPSPNRLRTFARGPARVLVAIVGATFAVHAQVRPDHAIVASRSAGVPATVLVDVDLTAAQATFLGRFPGDDRPPLALRIDPVDRDVLLAVDLGGGTSRVLRMVVRGAAVVRTQVLADIPGLVSDLIVPYPGDVYAATGGPQGTIVHIPRTGGAPTTTQNIPRVVGITSFGAWSTEVWLAEAGTANTPAQLRSLDVRSGLVGGPYPLGAIQPPALTGVGELLASLPTHVLSDASGRIWQSLVFRSLVQLPLSPVLPPGGAVALRVDRGSTGYVLGGAVRPLLSAFDAWSRNPQQLRTVSPPLPGDPVTFDVTGPSFAREALFATRCSPAGTPPANYPGGGRPQLGNARFRIDTRGVPGSSVLLVLGASDDVWLGTPLPLTLPGGGCPLVVAGDVLFPATVDASGFARQPLPIPNIAALSGVVLYVQWVHALGGGALASTDAYALHVFP